MTIDAPACIDCKKFSGCLCCEKYADGIPNEIIVGEKKCKDFSDKQ